MRNDDNRLLTAIALLVLAVAGMLLLLGFALTSDADAQADAGYISHGNEIAELSPADVCVVDGVSQIYGLYRGENEYQFSYLATNGDVVTVVWWGNPIGGGSWGYYEAYRDHIRVEGVTCPQ